MKRLRASSTLWIVTLLVSMSFAAPEAQAEPSIPDVLKPWQQWVLERDDTHRQSACPFLYQREDRVCVWPELLRIEADKKGGGFALSLTLYADGWVNLPGNHLYWPMDVALGERALPLRGEKQPQVWLTAGQHVVTGNWQWQAMPKVLPLPKNTGLVTLILAGKQQAAPVIDKKHQLWLNREKKIDPTEKNTAYIRVSRHISDLVPTEVHSRIDLNISGEAREILIGPALLGGLIPLELNSPLPARIEPDGKLRVQIKAGSWAIHLYARSHGVLDQLELSEPHGGWPNAEPWVFEAQPALRRVDVQGPRTVDPQQTHLPQQWRHLPAYLMMSNQNLQLKEKTRGDALASANQLTLNKQMWLDFDGAGLTMKDHITGRMNQTWRLDVQPQVLLGQVNVNGQASLITINDQSGNVGVELRQTNVDVEAVSRITDALHTLPTSGWQEDFEQVNATLHLPPGWSLLSALGVDRANGAWLGKWNLWDIFLVLLITFSIGKLFSWPLACLAFSTLLMTYHREQAPLFIWLNLALVIGLLPLVKDPLLRWLKSYQAFSFAALVLALLPFIAQELRLAVYPQLERQGKIASTAFQQAKNDAYHDKAPLEPELDQTLAESSRSVQQQWKHSVSSKLAPNASSYALQRPFQEIDPQAIVQTGPGIPNWQWQVISLKWSGPVTAEDTMRLVLVSPLINRLGRVFSVVLSLALAFYLFSMAGFGHSVQRWKHAYLDKTSLDKTATHTALVFFLVFFTLGVPSQPAEASSEEGIAVNPALLDELYQRLNKAPECLPECGSINRVHLFADTDELQIEMLIDAHELIAVPLPVKRNAWMPSKISVNGKPGLLTASQQGRFLIAVPKGRNQIQLRGPLNSVPLTLPFKMRVHNFTYELNGWTLSGESEGQLPAGSLKLDPLQESRGDEQQLLPDPAPSFVRVTRHFTFGRQWRVSTTVSRIAPKQGQISVNIPLLPGEAPLSSQVKSKQGVFRLVLGRAQNQFRWQSNLEQAEHIELRAADKQDLVEVWRVELSPMWQLQTEGLAPIKPGPEYPNFLPEWRPRPGEILNLKLSKPAAAPGANLTIDQIELEHRLGRRSNTTKLDFSVRTSLGQNRPFSLPVGAQLSSLTINGIEQAINPEQREVMLALSPGVQNVVLNWRDTAGTTWLSSLPPVNFEQTVTNIRSTLHVPSSRWPLLVGGPGMGPAVLIWSVLSVVLCLAFILGRLRFMPLRTRDWLLLGLGTASVSVYLPLPFILWIAALAAKPYYVERLRPTQYKLSQAGLLLLGLIALATLFLTIPSGLLSRPDMLVVGNGSNSRVLSWFEDMSTGAITQGWLISLPMWVYRAVMLLWSLWLAMALIHWCKWAWERLNAGGFWDESADNNKVDVD